MGRREGRTGKEPSTRRGGGTGPQKPSNLRVQVVMKRRNRDYMPSGEEKHSRSGKNSLGAGRTSWQMKRGGGGEQTLQKNMGGIIRRLRVVTAPKREKEKV